MQKSQWPQTFSLMTTISPSSTTSILSILYLSVNLKNSQKILKRNLRNSHLKWRQRFNSKNHKKIPIIKAISIITAWCIKARVIMHWPVSNSAPDARMWFAKQTYRSLTTCYKTINTICIHCVKSHSRAATMSHVKASKLWQINQVRPVWATWQVTIASLRVISSSLKRCHHTRQGWSIALMLKLFRVKVAVTILEELPNMRVKLCIQQQLAIGTELLSLSICRQVGNITRQ